MLAFPQNWCGHFQPRRKGSKQKMAKRLFDLTTAIILLLLAAIPMILLATVIRFRLGSPVLFRQQRPGFNGVPFQLAKFRSMTDARDRNGNLLEDSERLTPFGRWMRATSLDELPTLWNVVRGDMSLVGPRPLLMHYLELYSAFQARRHEVQPGVTGWAQINGRNAISWDEKFALDIWYVDHASFWLDMRILTLTALKVLKRDGISAGGNATMPAFRGNKSHE
jgi:sugar transferase EpsL